MYMFMTQCPIQSLLRYDAPAFKPTMPTEFKEPNENATHVFHYKKAKVLNQILRRNDSKTISKEEPLSTMRKNQNEFKKQNKNSHIGITNEPYIEGKIGSITIKKK